ncbi:MAG: polysaccharide biosynthesis C-terminal domain-containing protein, partial [Solobacterium sp.]|nr:polysaccharide biosynthesis C-terminal domain-containing protein [Solobacterium sp.]
AGSIIAECTVTLLQLFLVRKRLEIGFLSKSYLVYAMGSGLMYLLVVQLGRILPLSIPATLLQVGAGMIIYFAVLVLTREELCMSVLSSMRRRLKHA